MANSKNLFDVAVQSAQAQPTTDQLKQATEQQIVAHLVNGYNTMRGVYLNTFNAVWKNDRGLTPKQVFAQLDVAGLSLVSYAQKTLELLELANPGSTKDLPSVPTGWELQPELDANQQPTGRIIVVEPA